MAFDAEKLKTVKGFLDEEEGAWLHRLALEAGKKGPCLEIGSYCGKSTVYLGTACRANRTVLFSIDHHRGSEEQQPGEAYFDEGLFDVRSGRVDTFGAFRKTLEAFGLEDTVVPMVCKSEVAARAWATPLGLVFIDGSHTYESAEKDYRCWSPFLAPGGYLLIHDIFSDPAKGGQAPYRVYKQALESGLFRERPMVKTLGILRKKRQEGPPAGINPAPTFKHE